MSDPTLILAAAPPLDFTGAGASEGFELVEAAAEEGKPKKLPGFSMVAYTGGAMRLEGQYYPVVVDLASAEAPRQGVPVPLEHDRGRLLGHTTEVEISPQRIRAKGVFSAMTDEGDEDDAKRCVRMAKAGFPWQASIGAQAKQMEFVAQGDSATVNGRRWDGPLYVARGAVIREISLVPIGADGNTTATIAARSGGSPVTFEKWLEAKGIDAGALTDVVRATLNAAWKAEQAPPPAPAPAPAPAKEPGLEDILAAGRRENERRALITELTAAAIQDWPARLDTIEAMSRLAVEGKWDVQRFELELLRGTRAGAPALSIPTKPEVTDEVIEAAVCRAGGLRGLDKAFDHKVLEASHKQFRHGLGLQELLLLCAHANGSRERSVRNNLRGVLQAAFTPRLDVRAGVGTSTHDISGIVSNTANKFLREAFMAVESGWRMISSVRPVNDFKQITSYSLTGDNTYEKVAPGGEIKHGSLGELTYNNQADTYGKLIGIDRRDLINDDLGALTGAGRRLGRGGALKLNDVFWTAWLDDASFFNTDNSKLNYHADATTSLMTLAGLTKAQLMSRQQTDPDGKPLGLSFRRLLVPPEHEVAAANLMNSTITAAAQSTATAGLTNVFQGLYQVVQSTYLSNSSYTGYSTTAWYLLADPADLSVIEVCFLNGVEMPTIESSDLDFDRLGIAQRGYFDFGVAKQEYRAGIKMKGAA
jgi:hypothetical protein